MKARRIVTVALLVMFLIGMAGCQGAGAKPEATVKELMESIKSFDLEGIQAVLVDGETLDFELDEDEQFAKELLNVIKSSASKLSYKIGEVRIEEDRAFVDVEAEHVDLSEYFAEAIGEYMVEAMALAFSGDDVSDEEMDQLGADIFARTPVGENKATTTTTVELVKNEEGNWMVVEMNDGLLNIYSSNIYAVTEEMNDAFSGMDEE